MWNRSDLKARGKAAFKANWLNCIIVEFVLGLLLAAQSSGAQDNTEELKETFVNSGVSAQFFITACAGVLSVGIILGILINIFIKNPLIVGGHRFFLQNSDSSSAKAKEMIFLFNKDRFPGSFVNIFITMLIRDIFVLIGTILFIIPGIVLSYSYMMVPFILAENPDMGWKEALGLSKQMMQGQKMNAFKLDLSFIGWLILSAITCNILGVLYVNPYMRATKTELYKTLRG